MHHLLYILKIKSVIKEYDTANKKVGILQNKFSDHLAKKGPEIKRMKSRRKYYHHSLKTNYSNLNTIMTSFYESSNLTQ